MRRSPELKRILEEAGVTISAGEISNILTQEKKEELTREREEILKAGLESSGYFHTDDTGLKHKGKNHHVHVICNALFSAFFITPKKDRENPDEEEKGKLEKAAWENMMSILDTCRKQGVGFFDYVKDIFSGKRALTRLGHLISQKASIESTFY
ncbi:MAG: transposase [Halobacteriota archaeon]